MKDTVIKKCFIVLTLFFVGTQIVHSKGLDLKVKVRDLQDTSIILGYYLGKQFLVKDTIYLNKKGEGVLQKDEPLKGGLYFLYYAPNFKLDFLLSDNQNFELITDTLKPYENLTIKGSKENELFRDYSLFMQEQSKKRNEINEKAENNKEDTTYIEQLREEYLAVNEEVTDYWNNIIQNYPNTFLSTFMQALKPIDIPEFEIEENIVNKDSALYMRKYLYKKQHFWDNFDFSEEKMINTPILQEKLEAFFKDMVVQIPDSINKEADILIAKAQINEDIFQYIIQYVLNSAIKSKTMGMDASFVHIAENYYLAGKTPWATPELLKNISEEVEKVKVNLIGKTAPELRLETLEGRDIRLSETDADFIVLFFWDPECGHCKTSAPELHDKIYPKLQKHNIQIFSIYTQLKKENWEKFLKEKELYDWINVWDPYRESEFRTKYNIYSTPTIYLLDKDKKIIAKKIDVEQLEEIVKAFSEKE